MATVGGTTQCTICGKEKNSEECLTQHHEFESNRDQFEKLLIECKNDPKQHSLIQQIDRWEKDSIQKIKQTANECRQITLLHINKYTIEIENKLVELTDELKEMRQENQIELDELKQKLTELTKEFHRPRNISIEEYSSSFIKKIFLDTPFHIQWKQHGITVAGGNGQGNQSNQLNHPWNIFITDDETIYIVDSLNHRIMEWKSNEKDGNIIPGRLNGPTDVIVDKQTNSLIIADHGDRRVVFWSRKNNMSRKILIRNIHCWGLTMDKNGYLYVSDTGKHEVRRWKIGEKNGTLVAGGNGKGNNLNQLNCPTSIFIDDNYSLYILDQDNDRVVKWTRDATEGIIVAGGNGQGHSLRQLFNPGGIAVNGIGQIYVADSYNARVMHWYEGDEEGSIVVGGYGEGIKSDQLNCPMGLSFDRHGNLYVADCENHRIQKFEIELN